MKRVLSLVLVSFILLCFVGCAELVNTEIQEVEATVTDVYYKGAWTQFILVGKTMIPITHSAQYKVTFTYDDVTLTVDNEDLYRQYKDKTGTLVKCDLIVRYYDSGYVYRMLKLKEEGGAIETLD